MDYSDAQETVTQIKANDSRNYGTRIAKSSKPRGIYIVQEGEGGPIFKIETPESYAGRKNISSSRVTSLKKLARIQRVRKTGYSKRVATNKDMRRYGPAIIMGEDAAA